VWLIVGRGTRQRSLAVVLVVWLLIGLALFAFGPRGFLGWHANRSVPKNAELRCTFVDVGHGTSVIIEMPDGRVWLYDAGHMGLSERSHEVIASPLWSLQTARIDTLVISHADSDHYNATPGLIQRFPIGRIVSTKRFWESTSREAQLAHQAVLNSGNAREFWNSQSEVVFDDETVQVDVLHPPPAFRGETDNADSLCLQIEYAGVRVLLPGDIEGSGMLTLCESPPRRCQIMMAPHHGSLSHDVSELMEWCDPKIVVISGNERAIRPNVLQRFVAAEKLGITFADGAVQIRVTSQGTVESYHWDEDRWLPLEN
jgi:competence protein ComEC